MDERNYSRYFKAFGDPSRLRILMLLSTAEMTVKDVTRRVGLSQPTVSRHLAVLREAGIVENRREGQQVYYRLNKGTVEGCCAGFCNCLAIKIDPSKKRKKR